MIKQFYFKQFLFSISYLFELSLNVKQFYFPIDRTLSGATTPFLRGSGSDGNKGIFRFPPSFSITGATPSDYLEVPVV